MTTPGPYGEQPQWQPPPPPPPTFPTPPYGQPGATDPTTPYGWPAPGEPTQPLPGTQPSYGSPPPYGQPTQPGGYGPPSQPGGYGPPSQPGGYGPPPYQPGYGHPGSAPSPYAPVQPSGGSGSKALWIVLAVIVLILLLCGGGIVAVVKLGSAAGRNQPAAAPKATPAASATPADSDSDSGLKTVDKGDCVVNDGTDDKPELRPVTCGKGTYEVLSRIPFTTDEKRCQTDSVFGAKDADAYYVNDDSLNIGDFVLCLKKR